MQTPLEIFLETSLKEPPHAGWGGVRERGPTRLATQHRRERVGDILTFERSLACQHLVEHAPECPDVTALIGGPSLCLFRTHVRRRAKDDAHPSHRGRRDRRRGR